MNERRITGVVVDAGHGGEDPGAVSGNLKEKDFNLQAALYMYDRLNQLGIPAVLTRPTDSTISRNERINNALNAFGKDDNVILISNHINAGGGEGAEVVYALRNSPILANSILENIGKNGQKIRKVYQRRLPENPTKDYYYIIRQTEPLQSLLVEYGFIDNPNDSKKLQNNLLNYVEGVVKAIADYANVPYTSPIDTTPVDENLYIVKKGDTLYSIAKTLNTTVDELKKVNNLTNNTLSIGQQLLVPGYYDNKEESNYKQYIVQPGDTLYKIALNNNITVDELKNINNLTSNILSINQILNIPEKKDDNEEGNQEQENLNIYTVQPGDTLYKIALNNNITVDELKRINNLDNNTLSIGQQLVLPSNKANIDYINYTVQKGDSLYSIAKAYNITVYDLKKANNLTSNLLLIGQNLFIPINNFQ